MKTLEEMRKDYDAQFEIANNAFFAMMKANRLWKENPTEQTEAEMVRTRKAFTAEGCKVEEIKGEIKSIYNACVRA